MMTERIKLYMSIERCATVAKAIGEDPTYEMLREALDWMRVDMSEDELTVLAQLQLN